MNTTLKTIWRTPTHQCEIAHDGRDRWRLLLWIKGTLRIDEHIDDLGSAIGRALELRPSTVPAVTGAPRTRRASHPT